MYISVLVSFLISVTKYSTKATLGGDGLRGIQSTLAGGKGAVVGVSVVAGE